MLLGKLKNEPSRSIVQLVLETCGLSQDSCLMFTDLSLYCQIRSLAFPTYTRRRFLCARRTLHCRVFRQFERNCRIGGPPRTDGNSMVMVDYATQMFRPADNLIDMGAGGIADDRIVALDRSDDIRSCAESVTEVFL